MSLMGQGALRHRGYIMLRRFLLLTLLLVAAYAPSLAAGEPGQPAERDKAVAAFKRDGVWMKVEGEGRDSKLLEIDFRSTPMGDEGLAKLHLFPELRFVCVLA